MKHSTRMSRFWGCLIGFKIIEESEHHKIIRLPLWATENMIRKACEEIEQDAKVMGRPVQVTVGHRLVRVEEAERA